MKKNESPDVVPTNALTALLGEPGRADTPAFIVLAALAAVTSIGLRGICAGSRRSRASRQRAADALRDSEERLRGLVAGTAHAIWETEADGRITRESASWLAFTGQKPGEAAGVGWVNAVHPDDREHASNAWQQAVRDGAPVDVDFRIRVASGGWCWTNARSAPLRDASGTIRKWVGMNVDITQRKRSELALLESEQRFRAVAEQSAAGIAMMDRNGHLVFANDRYCEIVARPRDELVGKHLLGWVHPEDFTRDSNRARRERMLMHGEQYSIEHRIVRPDGMPIWVRNAISARRDGEGAIVGSLNVVIDLTERVTAEQALRESETRFRNMADNAAALIRVTDPSGACTYLNREWYLTTGQQEDQALGFGWLDATHPDDRELVASRFLAADAARDPFRIEYRLRDREGAYRWVIDAAAPRFGVDGAFAGRVGLVIDISDRKDAEQKLIDDDRQKDDFLAVLSHELRGPLAPLTNALQLIDRTEPLTERGRGLLSVADRQRRQLTRLVDDLLDVSRIARGKLVLRPEQMTAGTAVHTAIESAMPAIDARGQRVTVRMPDEPLRLDADSARLTQVLSNLLNNASKYTPDGGSIQLEVADCVDTVEIRVMDDGIGIDPPQLPRLFQPFIQIAAGLDRTQGGLGIGLSLVRRLVELHGGTVSAHSAGPGLGSTFVVRLPKAAPTISV